MTAWFYINTNIKDLNQNYKLKIFMTDLFCGDENLTENNQNNVLRLINNLQNKKLRILLNELIDKKDKIYTKILRSI
jgi:hypothetical protein